MEKEIYNSPLATRYSSKEMLHLFSDQHKYTLWRRLWLALAKAQAALGLPISESQIESLEAKLDKIDFDAVQVHEERLHHDVMAHLHAFGDECPSARAILHLGATSCYVTDNADLIICRDGLNLLAKKLAAFLEKMALLAKQYAKTPCLAYTHFQPAQPTTVGKRFCLWIQDFLFDLEEISTRAKNLQFLGVKGATGTQASFLALFEGDPQKVKVLEMKVAEAFGFETVFPITGQTYPRKIDQCLFNALSGLGSSSHKFATDIRLLAHLKEYEEPFGKSQVGSSAMPYKRNPILSEKVCGLARFIISLSENCAYTAATQWLERSLDDSSNRRLVIAQGFLTADAVLETLFKLASGIVINEPVIAKHLAEQMPFLLTENLLMYKAMEGGDRQNLHERLRVHSHAAAAKIKEEGGENDLLQRLAKDPEILLTEEEEIKLLSSPQALTGLANEQVENYLEGTVLPFLAKYR